MLVPNRHASSNSYRYGFQGQEKDDELKGEGNSLNYTFRMHDPRVGRFFAVDPLFKTYPYNSTYAFAENKVIQFKELEGGEIIPSEVYIYLAKCGAFGENTQKIVNGIDKSFEKTVNGIVFLCENPTDALKGMGNFFLTGLLMPGAPTSSKEPTLMYVDEMLGTSTYATNQAINEGISTSADKIINGDLEDRTEVITDVITGILGAKGTDKIIKVSSFIKIETATSKVASISKNFDYYGGEFIDDFARISDDVPQNTGGLINQSPKGLHSLLESLKDLPNMDRQAITKAINDNIPSLKYKGGSPDGRFMQWEQINGDIKVRIDPPDGKTNYHHIHISDSKGNSLDIQLQIKPETSPDVHIPISPIINN